MSKTRKLLIGGSVILLLAATAEGAAAGPRPPLKVSTSLFHNAQIKNCTWRYPNGSPCYPKGYDGVGLGREPIWPEGCRCVHTRTITGGGGTPGTVEVRPAQKTIKGGQHPDGPPGSVEVRRPD